MKGVGHSKPIIQGDELHHEYNRAGVCRDKCPDQLPFQCPNNYTELAFQVWILFLNGQNITLLRPNINFILFVSGFIEGIIGVFYVSG